MGDPEWTSSDFNINLQTIISAIFTLGTSRFLLHSLSPSLQAGTYAAKGKERTSARAPPFLTSLFLDVVKTSGYGSIVSSMALFGGTVRMDSPCKVARSHSHQYRRSKSQKGSTSLSPLHSSDFRSQAWRTHFSQPPSSRTQPRNLESACRNGTMVRRWLGSRSAFGGTRDEAP